MAKKLTLKERQDYLDIKSPGLILIDEIKGEKGSKNMYTYICECGLLTSKNWSDLYSGNKRCSNCSPTRKRTFEEKIDEMKIINPGIKLLSEFYKNGRCFCFYTCICGNDNVKNYQKLKCGQLCQECGTKGTSAYQTPDMEDVIEKVKKINKNILVIDRKKNVGKERDRGYEYLCKCLLDNNEWWAQSGSLTYGYGCPECKRRNSTGKNNWNWKGNKALRDFIRFQITDWKVDSFKSNNYKCDITNTTKRLEVHHYKNFIELVREMLEITKLPTYETMDEYTQEELIEIRKVILEIHYKYGLGVPICKTEHTLFHKTYGYKNNTIEQYNEFKQIRQKEIEENVKKT